MPLVGYEPTISTGEQPQNYALDCAATGIGSSVWKVKINTCLIKHNGAMSPRIVVTKMFVK